MIDINNIAGQLTAELSKILNSKIRSVGYESIAGGSINDVYKLVIDDNLRLCCKINSSNDFPGMFETESHGLSLLGSTGTLRVPQVLGSLDIEGSQVLITEWIETASPSKKFWELFGEKLALLHTHMG